MNQAKKIKTNSKASLYIHIPFCSHLCHYCDFTKFFYQKKWIKAYLSTLHKEITSFKQTSFFTIYVGGGTPTSLSLEELQELLEIIKPFQDGVVEYTFECNIESTTKEKLTLMYGYGVNRLSFGVQTTNDKRLAKIGRKHSFSDVQKIIPAAKSLGFNKISIDLIYGLPGQSLDELQTDLDQIIKLDVDHISTYSLTIHPHTKAYIDKWPSLSNDKSREYYDLILTSFRQAGYERYEVSNFARPGHESIHNHVYWFSHPFYGAGYGASGYIINNNGHQRYRNIGSFSKYLQGEKQKEEEWLDEDKRELEFLMNNLRLKQGFKLKDYDQNFTQPFLKRYQKQLDQLINLGLITLALDTISCTDEGLIKLDYVLFKLM